MNIPAPILASWREQRERLKREAEAHENRQHRINGWKHG